MFKRDTNRTPKQRADKALMNIVARLGGCGFLIYFVVKLMTAPAEGKPDATTSTIISIVFLLVSAFIIFITIQDLVIGFKMGRFKASTYEEQDLAEYMERQNCAVSDDGESADKPDTLDAHTEAEDKTDAGEEESKDQ